MSKITKKPNLSSPEIDRFIAGAPDAGGQAAPAPARPADPPARPADPPARPADPPASGGRKKPISLTIEPKILAEVDRVAAKLGISRASAFSLAVSRFIAEENREANR